MEDTDKKGNHQLTGLNKMGSSGVYKCYANTENEGIYSQLGWVGRIFPRRQLLTWSLKYRVFRKSLVKVGWWQN